MKKLIVATGSNLGDKKAHLNFAKEKLSLKFEFVAESQIYQSPPVDYLDQPDFFNQVLEFNTEEEIETIFAFTQKIEAESLRKKEIDKGPRTLDIDLLFYGLQNYQSKNLTIPHPRLFLRSFVVLPLQELPYYQVLKNHFSFPHVFENEAFPI